MLNGADPVIIFQFSKLAPSVGGVISSIPVIADIPTLVEQPPIPIYLSQSLTGVYIESEDKDVDIETDTQTLSDGKTPDVNQKGIASGVTINLRAKKSSIGVALLSAMIDVIFDKVSSKEYAISYLNGATTVFRGVLQSYAVNQNSDNDLLSIKIQLSKGTKNPQAVTSNPTLEAQSNVEVLTP